MAAKTLEPNEYRIAITRLKSALKQRGLTYRELAAGIGLSESGVKKIFSARDGSFQRLAQICRYAGLSLAELVEDHRKLDVSFTVEQQGAFLKDPLAFQVYWLLVYERRPWEEVRTDLKLSKTEGFRLLRRLDLLELIRLLPGDRMRLPSIKAVRWIGDGEFVRNLYRNWSRAMVSELARPESREGELFVLRYLQMSAKTYDEFVAALRALEDEFGRRSVQEMRLRPPGLEHVRWLVAADHRSFVTNRRLTESVT